MTANTTSRKRAGSQRTGYAVAAVINAVLLYLINGRPGWEAVPFLTGETERVLTLMNVSLLAGLVANLIYFVRLESWVVPAGGIVTTGIGLAVLIGFWHVSPFDFGAASLWTPAVRILLVVGIVGTVIAIPVQIVSLIGRIRRPR
ncbi:hypothetical protein [Paractinoplanes hotanensis]|uniref:Uncharacterized protein n=1 Tax=Paractinoplanes hotanensis TaxID=2906497 RepID=A0ABT0YGM9_9ACTN|nr:hypothetical protein [Actinoplanes hotanensis]MCM4084860.1 hypothetical protein [Actinoplanes hotanensis]